MSGGIFGSHNGRDTTGVCWAEAKDAAKHLAMHIIAIHNKESSGPECQSCQGRECYSIVTSTWITTHSERKRQNLIGSISGPSCQLLLFLSVLHDVNDENQSKHQLNVSLSKISTLLQNQISPWPTQGTTWNISYSGALRILTSQLPMALSPDHSVPSETFQYNSKQGSICSDFEKISGILGKFTHTSLLLKPTVAPVQHTQTLGLWRQEFKSQI